MLLWKSHGLHIAELYFEEELPSGSSPDIVRYVQAFAPRSEIYSDFFTLVTDLRPDAETLMAGIHKETRRQVRCSAKDNLEIQVWDNREGSFLGDFLAFYNRFAAQKGRPELDISRLERYASLGRLDLSRVVSAEGEMLVYHAHDRVAERVRLMHSASQFRSSADGAFRTLVGRANRWLHWQDLLRFKAEGRVCFDWGGWYEGKDNPDLLSINQFKESFGGEVLHTYNGEILLSRKAKVFARIAKLMGRR